MWELHLYQRPTGYSCASWPMYAVTTSGLWLAWPRPLSLTDSFIQQVSIECVLCAGHRKHSREQTRQQTKYVNPILCIFKLFPSSRRRCALSLCLDRPHGGWALPPPWSPLSALHWWGRALAQLEDSVWAESCANGLELEWRPGIAYWSSFVGESQEEGSKISFFRVCENGLHPPNLMIC